MAPFRGQADEKHPDERSSRGKSPTNQTGGPAESTGKDLVEPIDTAFCERCDCVPEPLLRLEKKQEGEQFLFDRLEAKSLRQPADGPAKARLDRRRSLLKRREPLLEMLPDATSDKSIVVNTMKKTRRDPEDSGALVRLEIPLADHPGEEVASDKKTEKPEADAIPAGLPEPDRLFRRILGSGRA
jgi:hypothetical protein